MSDLNARETEPLLQNIDRNENSSTSSSATHGIPQSARETQALGGDFRLFGSLLVDSIPGLFLF